MVFRRPRVNVKPNVQSSRPVTTPAIVPTEEPPVVPTESIEDQISQTTESTPIVESLPSVPVDEPIPPEPIVVTEPTPVPIIVESPTPTAIRPVFRRKPVPNIAARPGIIHRRYKRRFSSETFVERRFLWVFF